MPRRMRRGNRMCCARMRRTTAQAEPVSRNVSNTSRTVSWIWRSGSRHTRASGPYTSPTGSVISSSPRRALLRMPPCSRDFSTCSSASLIVPFRPSSSRSLKWAGSYTPSSSQISVWDSADSSSSRCQSALLRARRETSSPSTMPACPIATSVTKCWKPSRPAACAPDRPRSLSITCTRSIGQPRATARSRSAYWRLVLSVFSNTWRSDDWRTYRNASRRRWSAPIFIARSVGIFLLRLRQQHHVGEQAHELWVVRHRGWRARSARRGQRRRWRRLQQHAQAAPHAMERDGTQPVGARLFAHDLLAQLFVGLTCVRRQRRREAPASQRFFLRASARSMLRGCTVTPSRCCTSCASVRAWIGAPSL